MAIYLDHAAATPLDERVLAAMLPFLKDQFYNPSATYLSALEVRKTLAAARRQVAHWLGAQSAEIIFTGGGSEANNLAIHGIMRRFPDANIVVSSIEHESVLQPAGRYNCRLVKVLADGRLDLDDLKKKIDSKTVMVSLMYANNEIGTIQPIREAASMVAALRQKQTIYFHTDACQAANYLDLHVARLGVDLMTLNGGKIYGPKQSGVLYKKGDIELMPLIDGGGQEQGLRSGTENVAGIVGLAAALEIAQAGRQSEARRLQQLQQHFFKLLQHNIPSAIINGSTKHRLPNNIHLTIPGKDNERLLIQLDEAGIQAAAGSACSASNQTPSHVLQALGCSDSNARASLRFTMGRSTTKSMIDKTVKSLQAL